MKIKLIIFLLVFSSISCMNKLKRVSRVLNNQVLKKALCSQIKNLSKRSTSQQKNFSLKLIDQSKDNNFIYDEEIQKIKYLEPTFYKKAVEDLPIVCVDIFLVNTRTMQYLLIKRDNEPAKDEYWLPGGRLFKGESFFNCAKRKCLEDARIHVQPEKILGACSTTFAKSAWDSPTHTVNIIIYATCDEWALNQLYSDFKWEPVYSKSDNAYVEAIRQKFLRSLRVVKE